MGISIKLSSDIKNASYAALFAGFLIGSAFIAMAWFLPQRMNYIKENAVVSEATVTKKRKCSSSEKTKRGIHYKFRYEWQEETKSINACRYVSRGFYRNVDVGDKMDVYYVPGKSAAYSIIEFRPFPYFLIYGLGIFILLFSLWGVCAKLFQWKTQ